MAALAPASRISALTGIGRFPPVAAFSSASP